VASRTSILSPRRFQPEAQRGFSAIYTPAGSHHAAHRLWGLEKLTRPHHRRLYVWLHLF